MRLVRRALSLSVGVVLLCAGQLQTAAAVSKQSLAVPMYQYPTIGTYWNDIIGSAGPHLPFVIVDDANGTFSSADPIYTAHIASNASAGVRSIGYVHSDYQARSFQAVYNDINNWYSIYPGISGIFIDLVQNGSAADRCYISLLTAHVKATHPNDLVILNFGANVSPDYEPYGDIFVNAENDYATLNGSWTVGFPGFEDNPANENRFWQIAHTTSSGNYSAALAMLRARNAGWIYITDDTMPNPYDTTPSYWSTEVNDANTLPASTIPNRGLAALPSGCQDLTPTATAGTVTTAAHKTTTTSNISFANGSSLYAADPGTKASFVLPTGITLASGSGTNWSCNTTTNVCTYGTTVAASGTSAVLAASFDTSCSYTGGAVAGTLTNFAGNTSSFSITPTKPSDCSLADTGLPTGLTAALAGALAVGATLVYRKRRSIHYRLHGFTRY